MDCQHERHNSGHFNFQGLSEIPPILKEQRGLFILPEKKFMSKNSQYSQLVKTIKQEKNNLRKLGTKIMVMQDTESRKSYVLDKGLYNQKKQEVTAPYTPLKTGG